MSELRAPDPTLDALVDADLMLEHHGEQGVPVAHAVSDDEWTIVCGASTDAATQWEIPEYARWFAVPCRGCFPDAPPPGQRRYDGGVTQGWMPDSHLGWQVTADG